MAPMYTKGGVWTNVEDEILRAAVSKYGLNQWARVSSLLARKTARQAKARWTEWLDPSIRKNEWSREEDERLLHLAKIMPTQWRSIAPILGRTASQCIERYQRLLDDAEQAGAGMGGAAAGQSGIGVSTSELRTLRVGDIDPSPEIRPAKPDEVDMDDDEKEMLAEARARLANTQGKKARRKDRERYLQESRRRAMIQRRRQLKQAGIQTRLHSKPKGNFMDYNADIPFEHRPQTGFYDVSEENVANEVERKKYLENVSTKGLAHPDSKPKKKDNNSKNNTNSSHNDAYDTAGAIRAAKRLEELRDAEMTAQRKQLVLSKPQVEGVELENVIKDIKRGLTDGSSGDVAKNTSVGVTSTTTTDKIALATRELVNMNQNQSSLLGEENAPLIEGEISPEPAVIGRDTPMNDSSFLTANAILKVRERSNDMDEKEYLRRALKMLPRPKNDFEIALPEDDEEEGISESDNVANGLVEDSGERDRRINEAREAALRKQLARRSQVIQRQLPRPTGAVNLDERICPAEQLIFEEMMALIVSDAIKYPIEGGSGNGEIENQGKVLRDLDDGQVEGAQRLIDEELETRNEAEKIPLLRLSENAHQWADADRQFVIQRLKELANAGRKQEKKLSVLFGGYMKRREFLVSKMEQALEAYQTAVAERQCYSELADMEASGLQGRLALLQEQVNMVVDVERRKQQEYAGYLFDRN